MKVSDARVFTACSYLTKINLGFLEVGNSYPIYSKLHLALLFCSRGVSPPQVREVQSCRTQNSTKQMTLKKCLVLTSVVVSKPVHMYLQTIFLYLKTNTYVK